MHCLTGQKSAHPHGRGENGPTSRRIRLTPGPSPRAWGKPVRFIHETTQRRTIPTGVGKTCIRRGFKISEPAHPHGRGENCWCVEDGNVDGGPSPRAWGKLPEKFCISLHLRPIPTGVGKTMYVESSTLFISDHPHGRGENAQFEQQERFPRGPSPRAWGKLFIAEDFDGDFRTIPTGVGKTYCLFLAQSLLADHPHGRGENGLLSSMSTDFYGPSPRAWGKHRQPDENRPLQRTIPTGVGKTLCNTTILPNLPDHPHGRGENPVIRRIGRPHLGPSPRAWGKPLWAKYYEVKDRTIPTGVGKTPTNWRRYLFHILYVVVIQLSNNFGSKIQAFGE